jgi:gas vesicle protein
MNPKSQRKGEIENKIEEILRNKILFIGNEIPEYFTKDKRDKQLYLGYPQQLIDELSKELSSLIREEKKEIKKRIKKLYEDIPGKPNKWSKEEYELRLGIESGYKNALDNVIKSLEKRYV